MSDFVEQSWVILYYFGVIFRCSPSHLRGYCFDDKLCSDLEMCKDQAGLCNKDSSSEWCGQQWVNKKSVSQTLSKWQRLICNLTMNGPSRGLELHLIFFLLWLPNLHLPSLQM